MYLRCTVSVSKHTHTHKLVVYFFFCCCLCFVIVYFDLVLFCPVSLLYLKPLFSRVTLVLAGSCAAPAALIRVAGQGHDCKLYVQYSVCLFVCIHFIFLPSALVRLTDRYSLNTTAAGKNFHFQIFVAERNFHKQYFPPSVLQSDCSTSVAVFVKLHMSVFCRPTCGLNPSQRSFFNIYN